MFRVNSTSVANYNPNSIAEQISITSVSGDAERCTQAQSNRGNHKVFNSLGIKEIE